jgi:hypothetical protein
MKKLIELARNCHILEDNNAYYCFSYDTCIAKCSANNPTIFLDRNWDNYSQTTNKHVYAFLRDYSQYGISGKASVKKLIVERKILLTDSL